MAYESIIGLEIHIQMKTKSKMFCGCQNQGDDLPPNTAICPICLGHPGTLPVINRQAVEWGTMMALAINCKIPALSKFDRKNYFYPDLPKGYQISMYDKPVGVSGWLEVEVDGVLKKLAITRLHLEEDAAKLIHAGDSSLVDFNRSGSPLMEIVTEPEMRSPAEAKAFLHELRLLARYLGVSNADMEKGQLRCDANISLRPVLEGRGEKDEIEGKYKLYPKTEIKNLNSFKAVERALEYEIVRQTKLWEAGKPPQILTTRGWNDARQETFEQRVKEEAHDYRYFPEPDLPPLKFGVDVPEDDMKKGAMVFDVRKLSVALPETPWAKRKRFIEQYSFLPSDARVLVEDKTLANYVEQVISELKDWLISIEKSHEAGEKVWAANKKELVKLVAGWVSSKLFKLLNESKISIKESKVTPENFAELMSLIFQNKVNSSSAQEVLEYMFKTGADPSHVIAERGLAQESDEDKILLAIEKVIKSNPGPVEDFRHGKTNVAQFLAGLVMKESKGKANPNIVQKLLKEKLA